MEELKQYLKAAIFGELLLRHFSYIPLGLILGGGMIFYL